MRAIIVVMMVIEIAIRVCFVVIEVGKIFVIEWNE